MLDLGTTLLAAVKRDPDAIAIVDGELRLTYRAWFARIQSVAGALEQMGLKPGDHLVTVLQNRWENATLHWACQFVGVIITPLNWRAKAEEIDWCIDDARARAIVFQDMSTICNIRRAASLLRIVVGSQTQAGATAFESLLAITPSGIRPQAGYDAWSVMLYTSGTTARPKGIPRRHCAERAAAVAHVAQNLYRRGEVTLGAMPLYHTMGTPLYLRRKHSQVAGRQAASPPDRRG